MLLTVNIFLLLKLIIKLVLEEKYCKLNKIYTLLFKLIINYTNAFNIYISAINGVTQCPPKITGYSKILL